MDTLKAISLLEASKQALEALEHIDYEDNDRDFLFPYQCTMLDNAITALRVAIASYSTAIEEHEEIGNAYEKGWLECQAAWKQALSKQSAEERSSVERVEPVAWMDREGDLYAREPDKNWCPPHYPLYTHPAPAAPVQEPVKLVAYNCKCGRTMQFESVNGIVAAQRPVAKPHKWVHATEWRGLTDEEIVAASEVATYMDDFDTWTFAYAIEAKLKEKNGY